MGAGKIGAQVAHASMELARQMAAVKLANATANNTSKIVLYVDSLPDLERYQVLCQNHVTCKIDDAGVTEVPPGSVTVLGIGPISAVDGRRMFAGLKLVR